MNRCIRIKVDGKDDGNRGLLETQIFTELIAMVGHANFGNSQCIYSYRDVCRPAGLQADRQNKKINVRTILISVTK